MIKIFDKNDEFFIINYGKLGLKKCCVQLGIDIKYGNNIAKRLRKHRLLPKLDKEIRRQLNNDQDYNKYNSVDANKFIQPTFKEAYILGLLWADGYLNNKSQYNRISIEGAKEDLITLKSLFKGWKIYERTRLNRKPQLSYICNNKMLYNFLNDHGYEAKSYKNANIILNKLPEELKRYWILGLFDGDGCVYINENFYLKQISISSSYNQDWNYVEDILKKLNINYKISRVFSKNGNKSSYIRFCGKNNCKLFFNYLYPKGFELGLLRKYEKMRQCLL